MDRRHRNLPFRPIRFICLGLLTLFQICIAQKAPAVLAGDQLITLLDTVHSNIRANEMLAEEYVCDDSVHEAYLNKSGKQTSEKSEKVESVFASGLLYHQIVEQNGKPVPPKRQVSLQKHQDAISELGSGFDFVFDLRDGNPRDSIYSALPICCLTTLFENHVVRHEIVNGRDNLVIESVPKVSPEITSVREATALDWKETTWIDAEWLMPTRFEVELLKDKDFLLKGSTQQQNYIRFEDEGVAGVGYPSRSVWLENYEKGRSNLKFLWKLESLTFEDSSYNFKRFDVKTRVLTDTMRVVDPQDKKPQ